MMFRPRVPVSMRAAAAAELGEPVGVLLHGDSAGEGRVLASDVLPSPEVGLPLTRKG